MAFAGWSCSSSTAEPSPDQDHGGAAGTDSAEAGAHHEGGGGADGSGGTDDGSAGESCANEPLDCDDCPSLQEFRDSCADAFRTSCGGTRVGPLLSAPYEFTYCYSSDGTLIGKISKDLDFAGSGSVEGIDCRESGKSAPLCPEGPAPMLTPDSEAIVIDWFAFFSGGYRFARRIDQLSAEQLELAQAIHVAPPTGDCWEDSAGMSIVVTDGDTERTFSANEYTGTCGRARTLLDFDALSALLDTVHCLPAKSYDGENAEAAPSITPDDGCWHGLFNATGASPDWWFAAEIPAEGEYRVALDECGDRSLEVTLFEDDATTERASATNDDGECPVLSYTFPAAGTYPLRVRKLGGAYAGDFYLSLESRQPSAR